VAVLEKGRDHVVQHRCDQLLVDVGSEQLFGSERVGLSRIVVPGSVGLPMTDTGMRLTLESVDADRGATSGAPPSEEGRL
jgi:hypothetical protein